MSDIASTLAGEVDSGNDTTKSRLVATGGILGALGASAWPVIIPVIAPYIFG